jgi:hypothetical protein
MYSIIRKNDIPIIASLEEIKKEYYDLTKDEQQNYEIIRIINKQQIKI